jgi:hypothetical protein
VISLDQLLQRRLGRDPAADAHAFDQGRDIAATGIGSEIARIDRRIFDRIGGTQFDLATAFRPLQGRMQR